MPLHASLLPRVGLPRAHCRKQRSPEKGFCWFSWRWQEKNRPLFQLLTQAACFVCSVCARPTQKDGDVPQEKEPDVMPKNCPLFLEKTASEWAFWRIGTGMIGTNHSKTHIVVVPGGAAQSISFIVSRAPAHRTGRSLYRPFSARKLSFLHRLFNLFYPAAEHFTQFGNLQAPVFV